MGNPKKEISSRLDIAEVVGEYVTLTPRGGRFWGLCPFHNEKTPSFTVNPEGFFYCFGCHKGGDIFSFVMEIEGVDFREALQILADKAGVPLEQSDGGARQAARESLLELNKRVSRTFAWFLWEKDEGGRARAYLQGRGFRREVLEEFGIGYAPPDPHWLGRFLRGKGYSQEFLSRSGLFRHGEGLYALFRDRIMFPIESSRGEVVGFGGRLLDGRGPKYVNTPETDVFKKREEVFGLQQAVKAVRDTGTVVLVEGYTDVLAASQAGIQHAVATLGTAVTEGHVRMLSRWAKRFVLLLDADSAGKEAAKRGIETLEQMGVNCSVVRLPQGKDPADLAGEGDGGELQEVLRSPISSFEYLLAYAKEQFDLGTPAGKESFFKFLLPFLSRTSSEVRREGYLEELADTLGVSVEAVRRDYRRGRLTDNSGAPSVRPASETPHGKSSAEMTADLLLMTALVASRSLYAEARNEVQPELLTDPRARTLLLVLEECFRSGESDLSALLERVPEDLRHLIMERLASDEFAGDLEPLIRDGIRGLKRRSLVRKRDDLAVRVRRCEREEPERVRDLLVEKMILDREIEKLRVGSHVGSAE